MTVDPWYEAVNNSAGDIIIEGAEQLTDWPLYICLVLLVSTAVAQVNYINRGMVRVTLSLTQTLTLAHPSLNLTLTPTVALTPTLTLILAFTSDPNPEQTSRASASL